MLFSGSRAVKLQALETFVWKRTKGSLGAYIAGRYGSRCFSGTRVRKASLFNALASNSRSRLTKAHLDLLWTRFSPRGMRFLAGGRYPEEYAFDLLAGWIAEDLLADRLRSSGKRVAATGDDREREFLKRPRAEADWEVNGDPVECFVDFTGTWRKQGFLDIKPGKMKRMMSPSGVAASSSPPRKKYRRGGSYSRGRLMRLLCYDMLKDRLFWLGRDTVLARCGGRLPKLVPHGPWKKGVYMVPLSRPKAHRRRNRLWAGRART